jgi:hypothetical protein
MNIAIQGFLVTSHMSLNQVLEWLQGDVETALKRILNFKVPPSAHKKIDMH